MCRLLAQIVIPSACHQTVPHCPPHLPQLNPLFFEATPSTSRRPTLRVVPAKAAATTAAPSRRRSVSITAPSPSLFPTTPTSTVRRNTLKAKDFPKRCSINAASRLRWLRCRMLLRRLVPVVCRHRLAPRQVRVGVFVCVFVQVRSKKMRLYSCASKYDLSP